MSNCRLGIDCGSVSVKAVLLNDEGDVVSRSYMRNKGIVSTLRECLERTLVHEDSVTVVGITGSGRKLAANCVGADVIESEILCHSIAAIARYPSVQTVLDIGGEDSKIISVRDGVATDFRMNYVCGAGTGAFIDTVAARLGINVEDVGQLALEHENELSIPGKCGVFAQSAVVSCLNAGASAADILWGIVESMVRNFLSLGRGGILQPPYVFQGAVAKNVAVVRALDKQLEGAIYVARDCEFMGAIGAALLAGEKRRKWKGTWFRGTAGMEGVRTRIVRGTRCPNRCEITQLVKDGKVIASSGNRCDACGRGNERVGQLDVVQVGGTAKQR